MNLLPVTIRPRLMDMTRSPLKMLYTKKKDLVLNSGKKKETKGVTTEGRREGVGEG